jgi:hypothetical protein
VVTAATPPTYGMVLIGVEHLDQRRGSSPSSAIGTSDYIADQLSDVLADTVAVENLRRVAAAVDAISGAELQ